VNDPDLTKFQQRLKERREREAAEAKAKEPEPPPSHDADLVPEEQYERSEADQEMDSVIQSIDIIDAYNKWCGKSTPVVKGGQREGIKISCPVPGHADKNPSAWINLDNQVWYCGACSLGGDAHDLAAYYFNYPVPGYKQGSSFHELRRKMAEDFGFRFDKLPGGVVTVTAPEPEPEEPESELKDPAEVVELYDDGDEEIWSPSLDWRPVVPEDTFLDAYMKATVLDDVPEEYHFFHGMLAIGFALGRDVRLSDLVPVFGNLFVCTLGRSGTGKSKARYHLDTLLATALPHDWTDPNSKGVRKVSSPGSAEVLIHNFQKPVEDPTNPKKVAYYAPVRGMIDFSELSGLIGRANRQGSVLAPTLMQFYDMEPVVATSSMTHGAKTAVSPYASALTTTQPKSLRTLVTKGDDASGFLNRWLFVPGTEKKRFAVGGTRVDVGPAVGPLKDIQGWAGSFTGSEFVEWSPEAEKLFTNFFHDRIEPDKKKSDTDLITRIDLLMKKMILLFSANRMEKVVTEQSVKDAIHCYQYLIDSYSIPAGQIGNTLGNEISEAIMYQVKKTYERSKRGMSLNEIAKALKHRKYPHDLLLKTADTLVKLDYIKVEQSKKGQVGRPTTRYKYVD
jgi:hypothetical protein